MIIIHPKVEKVLKLSGKTLDELYNFFENTDEKTCIEYLMNIGYFKYQEEKMN